MLPSETMIWQPEFTDKTLSRKTGAVQAFVSGHSRLNDECDFQQYLSL
ncbi:AMP nucleosidase [Escherichia coli]|nr:AMP nucleosidase [Escherichia coli]EFK4414819.1 AMP nucleosidase [Escherichia coli]EGE3374072.1 AMP nucleosidase [Escherichia coli]NYV92433.1 AMP nucleosidase [Escherichia coli]NYV98190.1 AMP nucleosidase [Escherichia coli]